MIIFYEGFRVEFLWALPADRMVVDYERFKIYYSQEAMYKVIFNLGGVTDETVNHAIEVAKKRVSDHIDYLCSKIYN
jgi:hypothetical protein